MPTKSEFVPNDFRTLNVGANFIAFVISSKCLPEEQIAASTAGQYWQKVLFLCHYLATEILQLATIDTDAETAAAESLAKKGKANSHGRAATVTQALYELSPATLARFLYALGKQLHFNGYRMGTYGIAVRKFFRFLVLSGIRKDDPYKALNLYFGNSAQEIEGKLKAAVDKTCKR